jgi:pimeloyl-ACP methyl ester carboxylesterase
MGCIWHLEADGVIAARGFSGRRNERGVSCRVDDRRVLPLRKPETICGIAFEAFAVEHSLLAPAVGYRVREVADKIPGAKFEVIKGDGSSHVVPIERPDDFNSLVTKFLS